MGGAIQEDYPDLGSSYMDIVEEEGLEALAGRTSPIAQEVLDLYGGNTSDEEEEDDDEFEEEDGDGDDQGRRRNGMKKGLETNINFNDKHILFMSLCYCRHFKSLRSRQNQRQAWETNINQCVYRFFPYEISGVEKFALELSEFRYNCDRKF